MPTYPPVILLDELRRIAPWIPDAVRTPAPEFGDGQFYAYVQGYMVETDCLSVRVDLPEDNPAVLDAVGDGWKVEEAEFITMVPRGDVVSVDSMGIPDAPIKDPRPALALELIERAKAEQEAARLERIALMTEEMRSGKRRRLFPELRA